MRVATLQIGRLALGSFGFAMPHAFVFDVPQLSTAESLWLQSDRTAATYPELLVAGFQSRPAVLHRGPDLGSQDQRSWVPLQSGAGQEDYHTWFLPAPGHGSNHTPCLPAPGRERFQHSLWVGNRSACLVDFTASIMK